VELAGTPELSPHLEKMADAGKMRSLCRRQEHEEWRAGLVVLLFGQRQQLYLELNVPTETLVRW
jgi:hypothetical protein